MSEPSEWTDAWRQRLESRLENLQEAVNEKNERITELELEQTTTALNAAEEKLRRYEE